MYTGKLIHKVIEGTAKNRITLIIAHRFSNIRNVVIIIVLMYDKIIEMVNYAKLIQKSSYIKIIEF